MSTRTVEIPDGEECGTDWENYCPFFDLEYSLCRYYKMDINNCGGFGSPHKCQACLDEG